MGTTAEARRFARLLEERDELWKVGTVGIIWNLSQMSKHVGGKIHAPIPYGRTYLKQLSCFMMDHDGFDLLILERNICASSLSRRVWVR